MLPRRFQRKLKRKQRRFSYIVPRASALVFVALLITFIGPDLIKTLINYPILSNYFIAVLTLAMTILVWKRGGITGATVFFLAAVIYPIILWGRVLFVSMVAISLMLFSIGALFLVDVFVKRAQQPRNFEPFKPKQKAYFREYKYRR